MVTLFVRHQVKDYAAFREVYKGAGPMQKRGGVLAEAVYQSEDDPNDVTVTHDFASLAEARALAGSAELQEAMNKAGVVGAPTVWFAHKV